MRASKSQEDIILVQKTSLLLVRPEGGHTGVVIYSLLCHSCIHSSSPAKEGMNASHSSLSFSRQYLGKKKTAWVHSSTPNTACIHFPIITKLETPGARSSPPSLSIFILNLSFRARRSVLPVCFFCLAVTRLTIQSYWGDILHKFQTNFKYSIISHRWTCPDHLVVVR